MPATPIPEKVSLEPSFVEYMLLVWMTGVVVNELINNSTKTGVSRVSNLNRVRDRGGHG